MDGLYFAVGWAERNGGSLFDAAYAGARYAGYRGPFRLIHAARLCRALRACGVVPGVSTLGDAEMDAKLAAVGRK